MKLSVKGKIILGCTPLILFLVGFSAYELHHYFNVRLYDIVGLAVLPSTHYSRLVGFIGEPNKRKPCDVALVDTTLNRIKHQFDNRQTV